MLTAARLPSIEHSGRRGSDQRTASYRRQRIKTRERRNLSDARPRQSLESRSPRRALRRDRDGALEFKRRVAHAIFGNARWPKSARPEAIAANLARAKRLLALPPATAGEIIVEGIERRAKRVLVGRDAKMIATVERLAPVAYPAILERLRGPT